MFSQAIKRVVNVLACLLPSEPAEINVGYICYLFLTKLLQEPLSFRKLCLPLIAKI
jgi:hypothetical protein